jgi:hypothetical protein
MRQRHGRQRHGWHDGGICHGWHGVGTYGGHDDGRDRENGVC